MLAMALGAGIHVGCRHTLARKDARDAAGLYALAVEQLAQGMLEEATADFGDLRARFPYSRYAVLSELRLADTQVKGGKVVEGIEAYRGFLRAHPQHDQAAYALLQVAEQQAEQLPTDHFLLPPSYERDQAAVVEAAAAFDDFLARFPAVATAERARAGRRRCRQRLAEHELYVARFYLHEGHWEGVCARARAAASQFEELNLSARAEALCAKATAQAQRRGLSEAHSPIDQSDLNEVFQPDRSQPLHQQQKKQRPRN